ncbi:MAG: FKBP-type peptidyl-prolyl cis-trans isomerase, partial [Candidatus Omnitrophota bacterium]
MEDGGLAVKPFCAVSCVVLAILLYPMHLAEGEGVGAFVNNGKRVSFDYTLIIDGKVVDSSKKSGPIEYTHGEGKIMRGLSEGIAGLRVGDTKSITLSPEDGYGEVNPNAKRIVSKQSLPPGMDINVGSILSIKGPDGGAYPVQVAEIKKD